MPIHNYKILVEKGGKIKREKTENLKMYFQYLLILLNNENHMQT